MPRKNSGGAQAAHKLPATMENWRCPKYPWLSRTEDPVAKVGEATKHVDHGPGEKPSPPPGGQF